MKEIIEKSIQLHKKLLADFENQGFESVLDSAKMIIKSVLSGGCVYICGNGGSAADAQHIAGELVGRFKRERKAIAAVAMTTDTSILTAIGNDSSFDDIFSRQVEALVKPGDILWAFSTSGSSKNILAAAQLASKIGAKVIGFTGKVDTALEKIADVCVSVDANDSAAAQQIHQLAYHIICDIVEKEVSENC
jgi:D-sedoheptulose 7-phosphate isomerase